MTCCSAFRNVSSSSFRICGELDEPVAGHVDVDRHALRAFDHLDPLARERRPHRREDPIEVRLAHEEDAFLRQVDAQVAAGVRAAQKQNLDVLLANAERGAVTDRRHRRGPHHPRGLESGLGRRMDVERDVRRKRGVAGRVIAVIRADDDVGDRLRRDLRNLVDHPPRLGDAALAVGDEHARRGDDEQADGREQLAARPIAVARTSTRRRRASERAGSRIP